MQCYWAKASCSYLAVTPNAGGQFAHDIPIARALMDVQEVWWCNERKKILEKQSIFSFIRPNFRAMGLHRCQFLPHTKPHVWSAVWWKVSEATIKYKWSFEILLDHSDSKYYFPRITKGLYAMEGPWNRKSDCQKWKTDCAYAKSAMKVRRCVVCITTGIAQFRSPTFIGITPNHL